MRLEYFQMLDRVVSYRPEEAAIAIASQVPTTSPVFEGHFPGHPLMPGVLLLETMAQASGYLILALNGFSRMPFFASAKEANFRAFVPPGSELVTEAARIHDGSGYAVMRAEVQREGKRVADAHLTFRIVPFPTPGLAEHVQNEARRLGFKE